MGVIVGVVTGAAGIVVSGEAAEVSRPSKERVRTTTAKMKDATKAAEALEDHLVVGMMLSLGLCRALLIMSNCTGGACRMSINIRLWGHFPYGRVGEG